MEIPHVCRIKKCNNHVDPLAVKNIQENLCNKHYFHYIWYKTNIVFLKNPDDTFVEDEKGFYVIDLDKSVTGMITFSQMLFPDLIMEEYGTPWFHYLIVLTILESIGKPAGEYSMLDRVTAFECFRGSAKTTLLCFLLVVYTVLSHCVPDDLFPEDSEEKRRLMRLRIVSEFIVIIMETQDQATQAVEFHQTAFLSNPSVVHYFGSFKSERAGERINEKFNTTTIQTAPLPDGKRCKIWARGTGQKFRGIRFLNVRPRLVIADDIESEDNTASPELRNKNKTWWRRRILNSCDLPNAAVINIGTMLGMDTILWRNLAAKSVKSVRIHLLTEPDLRLGKPVWEERFPLTEVVKLYEAAVADEDEAGFWQEYFGIFATEDEKIFPLQHFQFYRGEPIIQDGIRCLRVDSIFRPNTANPNNFEETVFDPPKVFQTSIGIGTDLAVSQTKIADNSSNTVAFKSTFGDLYFHEITYGKMEEVDVLVREEQDKLAQNVTTLNTKAIVKVGVISDIIRKVIKYKKIDLAVMETYAQQGVFVRILRKALKAIPDLFLPILEFNEKKDKVEKVKMYLRPLFITNHVWFNIIYKDTQVHLEYKHFPYYKKDDNVDSGTLIAGQLNPPSHINVVKVNDVSGIPPIARQLMKIAKEKSEESIVQDNILDSIYASI